MKGQMKRYFGLRGWAMFLAGAFVLSSCTEDEVVEKYAPNTDGEGISFSISKANPTWEPDSRATVESGRQNFVLRSEETEDTLCVSARTEYSSQDIQSRGTLVTDKTAVTSFEVFSNFYTQSEPNVSSFYFMKNEKVSDGVNPSKAYYWPPADCNLDFIALAPYKEGRSWTPEDTEGNPIPPQLTYEVPDEVAKHEDLMVARTVKMNNGTGNGQVPLSFNHILASVQFAFVTADIENTPIKSISISGPLSHEGTYTVGTSSVVSQEDGTTKVVYDGGIWTNKTATSDVTYSIVPTVGQAAIATTTSTTDNSKTIVTDKIITLPQSFAADEVTLTIVLDDGTNSGRTVSGTIPAGNWVQGTITTYTISITPAYTLEFTEYEEVLDAHYIITKIKFKTDVNWTMSVPDNAAGWAYLSKEKSNTQTETNNKDNEITSAQKTGMWTYVERCNKQSISGNVTEEGKEEEVTVYMLLRENASEVSRNVNLQLAKTGETTSKEKQFTQLGYKIYPEKTVTNADGTTTTYPAFAMERIEDSTSPYGFAVNYTNVKYTFKGDGSLLTNFWGYLWSWIVSAITNGLKPWSLTPNDIIINITTDVSTTTSPTNGLANTTSSSNLTVDVDQSYLIEQGWYKTTTNINLNDIKAAVQSVLSKNNYGEFTGTNDDSGELTLTGTNATGTIKWYLPAINEMLRINSQDSGTGVSPYTSGNITDDTPTCYWTSTALTDYKATDDDTNLYAYSWCFGATAGTPTTRVTTLKVRAARIIE